MSNPAQRPLLSVAPRHTILSLGLTGGIGSGKSTVARLLVQAGAHLVDTDAIAHQLTQPGGLGIAPIAARFGDEAIDDRGAMNRERMRQKVFADPQAKLHLESILHPLIGQVAHEQAARAAGRTVVFDVPLLGAQSRWRTSVERVLVIDCSSATQAQRVATRPGWTYETAQRVISQQMPRSMRCGLADAVIFNDGISLAMLAEQLAALLVQWPIASATDSARPPSAALG